MENMGKEGGFFVRGVAILGDLLIWAGAISFAALITMFAGSVHSAPKYYLFYLIVTQGIPLLIVAISKLVMIFGQFTKYDFSKWNQALKILIIIYALSFVGIFIIL